LWPRSIDPKGSGRQIFEKARGVETCNQKNDEGTAPVKVTCCRKQSSSTAPHHPNPAAEHRASELSLIQRRVCAEIETCLESSRIEDFKKQIQRQISRKWGKPVQTVSDIGKAMVSLLPGQVIPALKMARDETIRAKLNTGTSDVGYTSAVRNLSDNVLGWIMHMTVDPAWLEKNLLTLKSSTSAAQIDVQTAFGAGIVASSANEKCAVFEKNGKGSDWGAENFKERGACVLPGAEELGADFENVVQKIKQHLYCQFVINTPDEDPERLPKFAIKSENTRLASHINTIKEEGWNIFIPFDKGDQSHPFQDPRVIEQLKEDLECLDIFIHNYSDKAGALLFNELDEIQVWLDRYFRDQPDT